MEGCVVDVERDVDVLLLPVVVAALHNQYTNIIHTIGKGKREGVMNKRKKKVSRVSSRRERESKGSELLNAVEVVWIS